MNGLFYGVTVGVFLCQPPGGRLLPNGHRCRMWDSSNVSAHLKDVFDFNFPRQVLGAFLFPLAKWGMSLVFFWGLVGLSNNSALGFHLWRTSEREEDKIWRGKICPIKTAFFCSLPWACSPYPACEMSCQLTRLRYKLINGTQLAWRGSKVKKKRGNHASGGRKEDVCGVRAAMQ